MRKAPLLPLGVALFFILFPAATEGWRLHVRAFNPDEFQHVHAGWSVARGQTLYRDFFEHHHPLTAWGLSVPLRGRAVETDWAAGRDFLIKGRRGFFALSLLTLLGTAFLARRWGSRSGAVAAAFLAGTIIFWENGVEIRPDGPGALLVLAAVLAQDHAARRKSGGWYWISGVLWGAAFGISPKAAFPALGAAGHLLAGLFRDGTPERTRSGRWFGLWLGGAVVVPGATAVVLLAQGALPGFWTYGVRWNLNYATRFGPGGVFLTLLKKTPMVMALGAGGYVAAARRALPALSRADAFPFWLMTATLIGLFLNPVPYGQSFLFFLPLGAAAGAGVWTALEDVLARRWGSSGAAASLGLLLAVGLGAPLAHRLRPFDRNDAQWALLETIHARVPPAGSVLDAWSGLGVFRPHVDFFPQRNVEMRKMFPAGWERRLLDDLQSGRAAPRALVGDREFRALNPDWDRWISENFEPVNGNVVWLRVPKTSPPKPLENLPPPR